MDETEQDEGRPESANSENESENGFVEVTQEDAKMASQSLDDPLSHVPAPDDDDDLLYGAGGGDEVLQESGEGDGAGEGAIGPEDEKPLSPPPSPASAGLSDQLIDLGFGDDTTIVPLTTASEGIIGQSLLDDTPLIATAPEPLVPAGQSHTISYEPSSYMADTSPPPPPEREPTPPPPPPPKKEPTPPPTPPPKEEDTPPPVPERDPTPPPPPPHKREPTPPPPVERKVSFVESSSVEEVSPAPSAPSSHRGRHPKPRGYLKFLRSLHPVVLYILYWCDVKLSAVVLGVCLVVLLTLTLNTVLHTWILLLLSFMVVSLTYIVTKIVIDSFYNKKVQNPFNAYLANKITLPEKEILEWAAYLVKRVECKLNLLVPLLLFANIKYSLAFGVSLWLASFITNYITLHCALFILVAVSFSAPRVYDHFQAHIDHHVDLVVTKAGGVVKKIMSFLPFGKKKTD